MDAAAMHFGGQKVVDMDRDGLLKVIEYLADKLNEERDAHTRTLDTWDSCRGRAKG